MSRNVKEVLDGLDDSSGSELADDSSDNDSIDTDSLCVISVSNGVLLVNHTIMFPPTLCGFWEIKYTGYTC